MSDRFDGRAVTPAPGLARRRLATAGMPDLEYVQTVPSRPGVTPLLFLHGAFAGAWCWSESFLSFFAERGRPGAAVSLRGHGGSEGGRALRRAGVAELLDDVDRALEALGTPPILVAHSLGGYLAQRLIGRARLRGLVLLGSLPPDGMALVGPQLAMVETPIWTEALVASATNSKHEIKLANLRLLFGEDVPPERVQLYADRMIPEAPRAMLELHWPRPIMPALWAGLPTLVMNGDADRLVRTTHACRTALYHWAELAIMEGGHFLMLDAGHDAVAHRMLAWMEERRI